MIAFSAAGASAARAAIVRETVGSDATRPKTPGSARSNARSAKQSPPSADVIARSVITFAGSWTAVGLRHRPRSGALSRIRTMVSEQDRQPALERTGSADGETRPATLEPEG